MTDTLLAIYSRRGLGHLFWTVTITEHSLQAAYFAKAAHAPDALVVATLLHDIEHLIDRLSDTLQAPGGQQLLFRSTLGLKTVYRRVIRCGKSQPKELTRSDLRRGRTQYRRTHTTTFQGARRDGVSGGGYP